MADILIIPEVFAVIEKRQIVKSYKKVQKNEAITSINPHRMGLLARVVLWNLGRLLRRYRSSLNNFPS